MEYILSGKPVYLLVILISIYSFLGWIVEVVYAYYRRGYFVNRGFLYGPFCPIYGIVITPLVEFIDPAKTNIALLFVLAVTAATAIEYVTSFFLEKIFGSKWWDYSSRRFNIQGRVCLSFSLLWGIAGIMIYRATHPQILRFTNLFSEQILTRVGYIVVICFAIDISMTVISLADLNSYLSKLQLLASKAKDIKQSNLERMSKLKILLEKYSELENKLKFNQRRLLDSFPDFKKNRFEKLIKEIKFEVDKFREK